MKFFLKIIFTFIVLIIFSWLFFGLELGWYLYFSPYDTLYYKQKFSCSIDDDCISREYSPFCINKNYDGGAKKDLQLIPVNHAISCKCKDIFIMNHCFIKK